ncbi:MAG: hypothetical protein ABI193_08810, partial [Minicystis sp.]
MSDPSGDPGANPYDPIDLRRQIAMSFSMPELRQLAETLGVGESVRWDHGPQEAARDLVRQFERYYGLSTLVAKLKELRPLVDWPEPDALPPPASQAQKAASALPALSALSALPGPEIAASAPIDDPMLPAPAAGRAAPSPTVIDPVPSSPAAIAPPAPSRPAPVWPGTVGANPDPPRSQGIDARVLVLVAALTVLAAVIAYAAGRASNNAPAAQAAPADSAGSVAVVPLPRRAPGPATRVADAVARSLANVAKSCALPPGTEANADLLARAFERCGPPSPRAAVTLDRLPVPMPTLDPPRDPPADPGSTRPRPRTPGASAPPPDKSGPSNACLAKCGAESRSCSSSCGAEPQQSTQYEAYMLCR